MNDLNKLFQKLLGMDYKNMYEMEAEFFLALYYGFSENRLLWINAFLTISSWFGISMRSGVWTFYETANVQEITDTLQYLKLNNEDELVAIFEKGIHDY